MVDQIQNNNDFSSGFLIKGKDGKFKKVKDDKIDDYSENQNKSEEFVINSQPSISNNQNTVQTPSPITQPENKKNRINNNSFIPQPSPPVTNQASFIGEPDEEEEIRSHQEELNKILASTPTLNNVANSENLAQELINKFNLQFDNEVLSKRFEKIIESCVKGIRSNIETEEVLHRQSKVGGLDMPQEIAEDIVKYVADHKKVNQEPAEEAKKEAVEEAIQANTQSVHQVQSNLSQVPPDFIPLPKEKLKVVEENIEPVAEIDSSISKPQEEIDKKKELEPIVSTIPKATQPSQSVENLYQKTSSEEMAKIANIRQQEQSRPQVIDIRQPSAVVGPVEELAQVDTKEFRRLGNNPSESAEKILEKVYLLEEESWAMRMEGIAAWQKSPIHRLYIEIGQESLKTDKTVVEIISSRESSNKPFIHLEEFLALNDLNSKLVI
ncbi:MAG: hypothetical protein Q8P20_00715 [bacterium]|nr:hypothetical protein [bacterium]